MVKKLLMMGFCLGFCWAEEGAGETAFLDKVRQFTFEGKRAGEGYFSQDGRQLVFQSEREESNPFYQIYLMDLETGDVDRVSPGYGKTTCAWIHPNGNRVLFSSTHLNPRAKDEQREELEFRASGQERRYSWDYDAHFDLFAWDRADGKYTRLTDAEGYDAEASYSPDGKWIAFASNRRAYETPPTGKDAEIFERDKAYMMDIFIMAADGSGVKQLTTHLGYDGGPFFSPDGKRICWRRFSPDGARAEIFTMNIDGSDEKQLTQLEAMSWAPYYYPTGEYLIFATNLHGFANFELYLVKADGSGKPVRVTTTDGFDGLPVFSPDGKSLMWTSSRGSGKGAQLFMAQWNHSFAMKQLGLASDPVEKVSLSASKPGVDEGDLRTHVATLASEKMAGRLSGTEGERLATAYVAGVFSALGLEPAGDEGTYFQKFPFVAGVSLGEKNTLSFQGKPYPVNGEWRPLAFSKTGKVESAEVVFAGYGIQAPAAEGFDEYDSFVHLDVKDKWVMVFRNLPEDIDDEWRRHLNRFSSLRYKAMVARDKGARGLIVATGPSRDPKDPLVKLSFDASLAGTSLPVISVTPKLAQAMLGSKGDLAGLEAKLLKGDVVMGIPSGQNLEAFIDIVQEERFGRNVVARLKNTDNPQPAVIIGAHVDHLGDGSGGGSLARDDEKGQTHFGADDNASGVAGLLEIAQYLVDQKASGRWKPKRDVVFAAWSGEELGLLGSNYFVNNHGTEKNAEDLSTSFAAYLNMDMIGRFQKNLVLQGTGSSDFWASEIERRNAPIGLPIVTQSDAYLPTDATSFYLKKVPVMSAFTGSHSEYHSPRDTPDLLDYPQMTQIVKLMGLMARALADAEKTPEYVAMKAPTNTSRAVMRAYLGTIPDYAQSDIPGVLLSGVSKGGPAEQAGVKGGDVIVSLAGKKIENIYDYTYAIEAIKAGEATEIKISRDGKVLTLTVVPGARE